MPSVQAEPLAKLSDEEVLERSKAAMQPPIQYRMRVNNLETTVSQKVLANGVLATRTEAVAPGQSVLLCLDGKCYDILPHSGVVIDKTQIDVRPATASFLRTNDLMLSFVPEISEGAKIESRKVTGIVSEGKRCYEIETKFSFTELGDLSSIPKTLIESFPTTHTLKVDSETFEPIELRSSSTTGSLVQKYEYVEVHPSAEVSVDLFELPLNYSRVAPTSMNEYFDYLKVFWTDIKPKPSWVPTYPKHYQAAKHKFTVDAKTGFPIPIATTPEQAKIYADLALRQEAFRNQPISKWRKALFIANVVAILAALVCMATRRYIRLRQ